MYNSLVTTHYFLMIALLVLLLFTIGRFIIQKQQNTPFGNFEDKLSLITLIFSHIQLLLGFIIFFLGPWAEKLSEMGEVMKNSFQRLHVIEHPLTMIIAIILITIGRSRAKKQTTSGGKYKQVIIFYVIALILIVLRIPWQYING